MLEKKLGKKGQVTLFVIIAILVIVGIAIVVFLVPQLTKPAMTAEEAKIFLAGQSSSVKNYVAECVKLSYVKAIASVGYQGGYCSPVPVENIFISPYSVPYLVSKDNGYANNILMLSGNGASISREIDTCVDSSEVNKCINNFKSFRQLMDIKENGPLTWKTSFSGNNAVVSINYPLTLSKGEASTAIDAISLRFASGIPAVYDAALKITNSEVTTQDFNIDSYIRENPSSVTIERQGTPEGIYYYLTSVPKSGEEPYKFNFIVKR